MRTAAVLLLLVVGLHEGWVYALTSAGGLRHSSARARTQIRSAAHSGSRRGRGGRGGRGRAGIRRGRGDTTHRGDQPLHSDRPLQSGATRCPSCSQALQPKNRAKHMAFCCPDLLDPEGWADGDAAVVLGHARRSLRRGSPKAKAIALRFNRRHGSTPPTHAELCAQLGWSPRSVRDTISSFLRSIPPAADPTPIEVIYEDESVLAVNKPAGVPCSPPHRLRTGSVLNRVIGHLGPGAPTPHPVHRLDLGTSGVLLFAKQAFGAAALMPQFEHREVSKTYAALCVRVPRANRVLVDAPIDLTSEKRVNSQPLKR